MISKLLITNADDFGFTPDVNAGIVHAHRNGVLTATTLMANGAGFDDAVRLARETPSLDIGCHLVLVQGRSLITGRAFPETPGALVFALLRRRIDPYIELRAQVEKIIASGIRLTHLDSHKHTHIHPRVFRAAVRLAREFSIPFIRRPLLPGWNTRHQDVRFTDHFLGYRLTGTLNEDTFAAALARVKPGLTEFMCHPGYLGPELCASATRLKESRLRELDALTSTRIRAIIEEQIGRAHV